MYLFSFVYESTAYVLVNPSHNGSYFPYGKT